MVEESTWRAGGPSATGRARSPMALVAVALFLYSTCWKLMTPLVPLWAERFGATPLAVGAILTGYAVTDFASTPVLGALSDRLGRKPIIVMTLVFAATSFAMTAAATSLAMLFAAQIVGGLSAAIITGCYAMASDRTSPGRLAPTMAYLLAAMGVASAVGPALGGALSTLGPTVPFWTAAVLAFATTAVMAAALPETRRRRDAADRASARVQWRELRELLRSGWIHRLAAIALIFGGMLVTLETVLVLFTQRVVGWTEVPNEWLFAYLGFVVVVVQLGAVGRCVARFGELRSLLGGLSAAAVGLILIGVGTTATPILVGVGVVGAGLGLIAPLLPALFCFASPAETRGAVLGFMQGVVAVARLAGPLLVSAAFTWSGGAPFIAVGVSCLIGVCLLAVGGKPMPGRTVSQ